MTPGLSTNVKNTLKIYGMVPTHNNRSGKAPKNSHFNLKNKTK